MPLVGGDPGDDAPAARRGWPRRVWWLVAGLVVVAAVLVAIDRRDEIAAAFDLITRVKLPRLAVAAALEALSVLCFAAVPRLLLRAGGVRWSLGRATSATVAANAVAGSLPGGAAFSTAWLWRYMSRRDAGRTLAAAVLAGAGVASAVSLFLLLTAGVLVVGPTGPGAFVQPVVRVLLTALAAGLLLLALSRFAPVRRVLKAAWARTGRRSGRVRRLEGDIRRVVGQARSVRPGVLPWLWPVLFALLNWLFDAACLAAAMWALDIPVPWHALLFCYALTQLVGSLHLTPGNLGVAEATLAGLLVVYGMPSEQAIAATFLYRVLTYWALQPIGWTCWTALSLGDIRAERRGER
ncbi:lysylphosphatidylglycerol synthase transmembrane domain-containing protein [Streptomyces sp. NPDC048290]|uniref:lysylphosphatidylglycerol synthase transmembrane domain-containing protein n=1 Tax=Streptomyces sp. NPDC048290 TaxID=3155811 RepID=UPI0034124F65